MEKIKGVLKRYLCLMLVALFVVTMIPATVFFVSAATTTVTLTGLSDSNIGTVYTTNDKDMANWTASGDAIEGSSMSTSGTCTDTENTTTLTITNNKGIAATLSFDYAVTLSNGTIKVNGTSVTASASFSKELDDGEAITISIKSGSTSAASTIALSNIKLISDVTATVTFVPAVNGSYTVDGNVVSTQTSNTQSSTIGYSLVATPNSGYKFLGWYCVNESKYLSTSTTATMNFDSDKTITAKFTSTNSAIFETGGQLFDDLNEATTYAVANSLSKIVLSDSGTLSAGNYTIPAGITLLIPFDSSNTTYTDAPVGNNTYTTPSKFRELTMASGTNLTVNGELNLSAKHFAAGGSKTGGGAPSGPCSFIKMNSGSTITLGSGATAYVWGFIYGDGTLTAKSGSTVYENMQINDFRGGTATSNIVKTDIFPFSQYRVQNVEVEEILEYGSDVYAYTSLYVYGVQSTCVHFIGASNAMFIPHEGTVITKQYLPDEDHLSVSVSGDMDISSLKLSVAGTNVNSADYILPINSCFIINILSGTTNIAQDICLHSGVKMNISSGATLSIASGNKMILFDADDFVGKNYVFGGDNNRVPLVYSPTKKVNNSASADATIDVNGTIEAYGGFYTTSHGANIISSGGTGRVVLAGDVGTEEYINQYQNNSTQVTEKITPAKLTNGSTAKPFTLTSEGLKDDYYYYNSAKSMWENINIKTVTWVNDDGSVLATDEVRVGSTPAYSGSTPTKTGIGYTYEFTGWTPAVQSVTEDITYKAVFSETPLSFNVTWCNWDGTVLSQDSCDYGQTPQYNGAEPTREPDSQYKYMFIGWTPEVSAITGDVTYTATFSEELNTYHVVWQDYDGTYLYSWDYNYGEEHVYPFANPERASTECYEYEFSRWNLAPSAEENTIVYVACYTETLRRYTITWMDYDGSTLFSEEVEYGSTPVYAGPTPYKPEDTHYRYSFIGWTPGLTEVTGNAEYTAEYIESPQQYYIYMDYNCDFATVENAVLDYGDSYTLPYGEGLSDNYKLFGWSTTPNGSIEYCPGERITYLDHNLVLYAVWEFWNGWTEEYGRLVYYVDGMTLPEGWHMIEGAYYYIDDIGYALCNGIYWLEYPDGYGPDPWDVENNDVYAASDYSNNSYFALASDGHLRTELVGLVTCDENIALSGNGNTIDMYGKSLWFENGMLSYHPGLVYDSNSDGYYYFPSEYYLSGDMIKGCDYYVTKTNDMATPAEFTEVSHFVPGKYSFDSSGKMLLLNEIVEINDDLYYYEYGAKVYAGLIIIDGDYYYINSSSKVVHGRDYYVSKNNNLLPSGTYSFDSDGKMIVEATAPVTQNGIVVDSDGVWRYYVNGIKVYAGLIEIDGDYYYVNSSCEVIHGRSYAVSKNNNLMPNGTYEFDADGKMITKDTALNGIVKESDSVWYYYVDGVKTYAGLVDIGGDYYYVNSSYRVISNCEYYVSKTNDLLPAGKYAFDSDGKLIVEKSDDVLLDGIVKESDSVWYYYVKGVKAYVGLIQINGDYYYVNSSCEVIHGRSYAVSKNNNLMPNGTYEFDADGKMITKDTTLNGIVKESDSVWYYYVDGVKTYAGLIDINGDYYYVNSSYNVIHGRTYYVSKDNGTGLKGSFTFDDDGVMVVG